MNYIGFKKSQIKALILSILSSGSVLQAWSLAAMAQTSTPKAPGPAIPTLPTASPQPSQTQRPLPLQRTLVLPPAVDNNTPQRTIAPIAPDEGYTLGPGDRLKIDIFNVPEYSGENQVLADGSLNLALVGSVSVQGMTLKQASTELASRFSQYLKRPVVTLSLLSARPVKIAIAGEVNSPGSYTISTGGAAATATVGTGGGASTAILPTLTSAIQLANGITQSADIRNIQVRRLRPRSSGPDQVLKVDLWQLLRKGDLGQDLTLRDGDIVFIPAGEGTDLAEVRQLYNASFAPKTSQPLDIAVVGEVKRPGPYTIATTLTGQERAKVTTVTTAIQTAGGITQLADVRNIQVRRQTKAGSERVVNVDLWKLLQEGDLSQDLPLQQGDTVVIPVAKKLDPSEITRLATASFSPDKITVNVVGEVVKPGVVELPPNTPLTQALLVAGGFNNKAEQGNVQLVRLNPDGTVTQRNIGVNFAQGVNEENNPSLRPNDTIIVSKTGIVGVAEGLGVVLSPLAPITGVLGILRLLGL